MEEIKKIATKIKEAGGKLYLVGGAVRDELLGIPNYDEDYCIVGITPENFLEMFPNSKKRGKFFEVYDIDGREFAFARKEKKTGEGHKEFHTDIGIEIDIIEDLKRRDITINSIAKEVLTGEFIDPYKGIQDLKNKVISKTSEAFLEDPLRVYRVARFAAVLGFTVEEDTLKLMTKLKKELNTLSKERVFSEFNKALAAKMPSIFFEVLKKADVLEVHFKEIYDLIGKTQPEKYHPEGDAYNHTILVLDEAAKMTKDLEIRFSALVHDLGKGTTPKEILPHHYGHEDRGVELVGKLAKRIGTPKSYIKCGKVAAKEHMRGGIFYKMRPEKMASFIERVDNSYLGLDGLKIVVLADKCSSRECMEERLNFDVIGKECLTTINGAYIITKYGKIVGEDFKKKLLQERTDWIKKQLKK